MTFENQSDHDAPLAGCDDRIVEFHQQLNRVFAVLADHHRRLILSYLVKGDDDTATVGELLDYVIAHTANSPADLEDDERLMTRLHHKHLPQLDTVGFVDYDARSKTVRYRGHPLLEDYLALANDHAQQTDEP